MPDPIVELSYADFRRAESLCCAIPHNRAIVYAVLEGHSPGRVFVDQPDSPACALLYPEGAYFYVAGDENNEEFCGALPSLLFDRLSPLLAEPELVLFPFTPAWQRKLELLLGERGVITIRRKIFHFNPQRFALQNGWRSRMPEGFRLQPIDSSLVIRQPAFQPLLDPATQRFGFAILYGEQIASACTAVFVGGGEAEIDIFTEEAYRGRGLATLAACAFIEECQSRGLVPIWSCWPEREASWALALKLGFEECPDAPALLWAEGM